MKTMSIQIIIILCLFYSTEIDGLNERPGYSDYIYHENVHGWTKLHLEQVDWETAKANCEDEGATLFYPLNQEFRAAGFRTIIAKMNITSASELMPVYTAARVQWLGPPHHLVDKNGTHNSDDDILPGDILKTEENALTDSDFYGESASFDDVIPLNDTRTSNETSSSTTSIFPSNYLLDPRTGHCYKLYNYGKTWIKSREICQNDGGDLVVLNSLEEMKFVRNIYKKYKYFIDTFHSFEMFVGIYEKEIYSWRTINGDSLNKAGYAVWAEGRPGGKPYNWPASMKDVRRTCGTIDKLGRYNDCWCEYAHGNICEKLATDLVS